MLYNCKCFALALQLLAFFAIGINSYSFGFPGNFLAPDMAHFNGDEPIIQADLRGFRLKL